MKKYANYRVLVDWDGDSSFNTETSEDTPLNLIPASQGQGFTNLRGVSEGHFNPTLVEFADFTDEDENGLTYRRIYNKNAPSDDVDYASALINWYKGQTRPNMNHNYIEDGSNMSMPSTSTASGRNFRKTIYAPSDLPDGYNVIRSRGKLLDPATTNFPPHITLYHDDATWNNLTTFVTSTAAPTLAVYPQNQTVRISAWVRLRAAPEASGSGGDANNWFGQLQCRWFRGNGTTSPILGGTDTESILEVSEAWTFKTWELHTGAFTDPIGLDFKLVTSSGGDTGVYDLEIGAVMLQATSGLDVYYDYIYHDLATPFKAEQFPSVLESGKAYRGSFNFRRLTANGYVILDAWTCEIGTTNLVQVVTNSLVFVGSADWYRYEYSIPSAAYDRGLYLRLTIVGVGGFSVVHETDFKGFMLWEGTEVGIPFNPGTINGYDDITRFVNKLNWRSGKQEFEDALPFEGTLDVYLNNDSKIFSPNNTDSILYGYMKPARLIQVQVYDPETSSWAVMWSGETIFYEANAGRTTDRQAVINCEQGMNRLDKSETPITLLYDSRIDPALQVIVEESAWRTSSPYQAYTDSDYRLDDNAFVKDEEAFVRLDQGVNVLEVIGQDWDRNTAPSEALNQLLESENGQMWITRDGRMLFANRDYWINKVYEPIGTLLLDRDVQNAEYRYGEKIVNTAEVILQPKKESTEQPVWETKRAILVAKKQTRDIGVQFDLGNGLRPMSVTATNDDLEVVLKRRDPKKYPNDPPAAAVFDRLCKVELLQDSRGRYVLRIKNSSNYPLYVNATISGTYQEAGDEITALVEDRDAISRTYAVYKEILRTSVLSNATQAESTASAMILRNADADGEFTTIKFMVEDETTLARAIAYEIGECLYISETQTAETARPHVILGIDGNIDKGMMYLEYTLARIDDFRYALTDESVVATETLNMIEHTELVPTNGGKIKYINVEDEPVTELQFGQGASTFWIGSHERMFYNRNWNEGLFDSWPEFTTGGAPIVISQSIRTNGNTLSNSNNNNGTKSRFFEWPGGVVSDVPWTLWEGVRFSPNDRLGTNPPRVRPLIPVKPGGKYRVYITSGIFGSTPAFMSFYHNTTTPGSERGVVLDDWTDTEANTRFDMSDEGDQYFNVLATTSGHPISERNVVSSSLAVISLLVNPPLYQMTWVQMDAEWAIDIDATASHYLTLWASVGRGMAEGATYTVKIYDVDAVTIVDTDIVINSDMAKYEFAIPSGNSKVAVNLHRTSTDAATYLGETVWLYSYAVTEGVAPDDYHELQVDNPDFARIYV